MDALSGSFSGGRPGCTGNLMNTGMKNGICALAGSGNAFNPASGADRRRVFSPEEGNSP